MASVTGGTAVSSIRMNAAARVLGAPRPTVASQRAQRATGAPRLPGRPGTNGQQHGISQHQAATPKPIVQHPVKAPHALKPIAPHPAATLRSSGVPPAAFNPLQGDLNSKQLAALSSSITRENDEATLKPLAEESKQISGAEGAALTRYGQMGQTGQQIQAGLQQGLEASAKTGENQAADAALSASKAIETSGQSAAAMNGGQVNPAVQAALSSAQNQTAGLGGAAEQYQQAMGVSGQGLMANLRAAAAQRVTEGAGKIAQEYAASQGKIGEKEANTLAKQPAEAKSLAVELGQKQLTDAATLKSLGVKEGTLKVTGEKAATEKAFKEGETRSKQEEVGVKQAKLGIEREKNEDSLKKEEIKVRGELEKQGLANAGALAKEQVKAKYKLEEANKKAGRLTTPEEYKANTELSAAYTIVQESRSGKSKASPAEIREALTRGHEVVKNSSGKEVKETGPKVENQVLITAALELWNYHKVSPVTERQLKNMGIQSVPSIQNGEIVFS
jgi:hypothetical protein